MSKEIVYYKSNPDCCDYFMFDVGTDYLRLLEMNDFPFDVRQEFHNLDLAINKYREGNSWVPLNTISIRKDSILGKFFLEHEDLFQEYIDYRDVVGAYNVAAYTENVNMTNILWHPLMARMNGTRNKFLSQYPEDVVDYISSHRDFHGYLDRLDGEQKSYLVYEDGIIFEQEFSILNQESVPVYQKK